MKKSAKRVLTVALLLIATVSLTLLSKYFMGKTRQPAFATATEEHFGTIMTITLYGDNTYTLNTIIKNSFLEVSRLENIFSAKLPDSELSRMNERAFDEEVMMSDELYYLISQSIYYNELTKGAFDISVGNMINLWGIGTDNARIPDFAELDAYINIRGCRYIILDDANKSLHFEDPRIRIDLGAIAKGYAADIIKDYITSNSKDAYGILNFGGNVVTIGSKDGNTDWTIGITNPLNPSEVCASVAISDMCVVTSGNYERYFEADGIRYHHILDPSTGYPADSGIISATIIGSDSLLCDALSTGTFVLGLDDALELIEGIDGVEAIFIDADGEFHTTSGMNNLDFKKR